MGSRIGCLKCRFQVGNKIVRRLKPNGEAYRALADAKFGACLGLETLVGGGGWVGYEALCVTQIVGDARDPQCIEEAERLRFAAVDVKGDDLAAAGHLLSRNCMLRVVVAERVEHTLDAGVAGQRIGDLARVFALRLDANRQRFEALQHDPGVEWADRRAGLAQEVLKMIFQELR